jgi:hypothetical protein
MSKEMDTVNTNLRTVASDSIFQEILVTTVLPSHQVLIIPATELVIGAVIVDITEMEILV